MVWIGLISYPLYLWHWPLLVFFAIIKFGPLTLLERELILLASVLLAWMTYRFVEKPFRFGPAKPAQDVCALCRHGADGGRGRRCRLGPRFRFSPSCGNPRDGQRAHGIREWRFHQCLLDLSQEMSFAENCVDRNRRPLVLVWGNSTAAALLPVYARHKR